MYPHSYRDLTHTRLSPHYTWDLAEEMLDIIRVSEYFQRGLIFHHQVVVLFCLECLTSEARFANTVVAIDAIFANAIVTRVTGTIIKIYLTVGACRDK